MNQKQQQAVIKPWGNSSVAVKNLASYQTIYEIQSEEYKTFLKKLVDIQNKQATQKQKDLNVQNKPSYGNNQQEQNDKKTYQNKNSNNNNNNYQNNNKSYQNNNNNKSQNNNNNNYQNNNNNNQMKQQKGKYQQKENQNSNSNSFLFKNENSEGIQTTNQQQANFNNIQDFSFKKGNQINQANSFNNVKQTIQSFSLQKSNTNNNNNSNSFSNISFNNQNKFENQNKKIVIPDIPDSDDEDDEDEQEDDLFVQQILQNIPKSNPNEDVKKTNNTFNLNQQLNILNQMEEEEEEEDNDDDILQIANNLKQEFFKSSEPNYGQKNQKKDKTYKITDDSTSNDDIKLQQILKKWN
ncbi:hypothetical protein TTHERM_00721440 (macronuclear) [Tetrahymena thermophila SB210]|uniref:Uncharacterized protein n=1 Tax=Tetrahymena thermophila (strain SB210) TaxID=312017 RepID=Q22G13_TETTS|nr:hypothetical protein TTHERM_00721440 [Tetrahymena thermophila SB210]EAR84213.1 hypothetical protein TTHERM_00721440 [Tetrahymena thermophila SB210]|eukprot:XP_001031876.1 hypothetical protein TTHERM_00721440 [Tetrahymena thermophila SB210]